MSSFTEILTQMGHACLTLAQDPRVKLADQSPASAAAEIQLMALKGDLLNELAAKLDPLFCKAAENALTGTFVDGQYHLDGTEVGIVKSFIDDYFVAPIHATIGEWEADEAAGWNDRTADERGAFWGRG
jgi:hypothetical protein